MCLSSCGSANILRIFVAVTGFGVGINVFDGNKLLRDTVVGVLGGAGLLANICVGVPGGLGALKVVAILYNSFNVID